MNQSERRMNMKTCNCGGNNSLRISIGSVRCECGGVLSNTQTLNRLISRLNDIEEDQFRMIGALQRLGADRCDQCGDWDIDTWQDGDDCLCKRCIEFNQDLPLSNEDLDEDTYNRKAKSIVKYLTGRGIKVTGNALRPMHVQLLQRT